MRKGFPTCDVPPTCMPQAPCGMCNGVQTHTLTSEQRRHCNTARSRVLTITDTAAHLKDLESALRFAGASQMGCNQEMCTTASPIGGHCFHTQAAPNTEMSSPSAGPAVSNSLGSKCRSFPANELLDQERHYVPIPRYPC